jgi:hypothetical protein
MNAGRNTHRDTPMPPDATDPDELAEETRDSEHRFLEYVLATGIRLADFEAKT